MKLWCTRCHGGRYLLTLFKPTIARIRGTDHFDAFERVGEPIAVRYLCEAGIVAAFGQIFEPLKPTKVEILARVI